MLDPTSRRYSNIGNTKNGGFVVIGGLGPPIAGLQDSDRIGVHIVPYLGQYAIRFGHMRTWLPSQLRG